MNANFNGHDLDDYLRITSKLQRNIGRSRNNELVTMGRGQRKLVESLTDEGYITMPFVLRYDLITKKRALADIFNVVEPVPLWFEDEPDKYYLAIPDGDIPVDEIVFLGKGSIKFLIPDGVAHSFDQRHFPFQSTSEGIVSNIENNGTEKTPIDISILFESDAQSIGIVGNESIVQFGTSLPSEDEDVELSNKIMNDDMGSATKNLWSTNVGRPRWRYQDGENSSKVEGAWTWSSTDVTATSFGSFDTSKKGYWHGPTLTRELTIALQDIEVYHRIEFKPTGNAKQRPSCQGLFEINYSDADNNFVLGFEMKDNTNVADKVTFSFFVGDYRFHEESLPKSVLTYNGGFFGYIQMRKFKNKFSFKLVRVELINNVWKEVWSSKTREWTNNAVAMLSVKQINVFASQWRDFRTMSMKLTHTRITELISEGNDIVPRVFYEGDQLFVDGETNDVFLNGIPAEEYRVAGSDDAFWAEKGLSEFVAISDGSFTGELTIRERYV